MTEITYPSSEEVNELLERADAAGLENSDEYRRVLFAARGCKAEAIAYANLKRVVG